MATAILGMIASPVAYATNYGKRYALNVNEKVVQFGDTLRVIGVPVNQTAPEYYFQASQTPQKPCLTEDDIQKIADLVIKSLETKFGPGVLPNPSPTPAPSPSEDPVVTKAENIISQKCASCHGVSSHGGDFDFVSDGKVALKDLQGSLPASDIAWMMYDAVFHGSMPKGQAALSDDEVSTLQDYALLLTKQERAKSTNK